ncbi:MAG: TRAP transporter small permease subunit [Caldilineaceae bacterium]|nr:TRAP transporter small permease subunit [Caldilineaceae bacterium]
MKKLLAGYVRIVDRLAEFTGWLSQMFVIIVVGIGFYNVLARFIGRYVGRQLSSNVFIEAQWYLFSLVFLLGFNYILKHGINVRVDFLFANWPRKRQAQIDFWGHLLFLVPFCLIAIQVTINPVMRSWGRLPNGGWGSWEMSPDPGGLPRAPIKSMIIVAFVLLLLQAIAELIKLYPIMRTGKALFGEESIADAPLRIE